MTSNKSNTISATCKKTDFMFNHNHKKMFLQASANMGHHQFVPLCHNFSNLLFVEFIIGQSKDILVIE